MSVRWMIPKYLIPLAASNRYMAGATCSLGNPGVRPVSFACGASLTPSIYLPSRIEHLQPHVVFD